MKRLILKSLNLADSALVECDFERGPRAFIWIRSPDLLRKEQRGKCYWRMVGKDSQDLLSCDLLLETGELFSVELLVYTHKIQFETNLQLDFGDLEQGVPIFDISSWPARVKLGPDLCDISQNFNISLGLNFLRITLFDLPVVKRVSIGKKLICEFDANGELCGFIVLKLSEAERGLLSMGR